MQSWQRCINTDKHKCPSGAFVKCLLIVNWVAIVLKETVHSSLELKIRLCMGVSTKLNDSNVPLDFSVKTAFVCKPTERMAKPIQIVLVGVNQITVQIRN